MDVPEVPRNALGHWLPGQSANPAGRPKGRRITDEIDRLLIDKSEETGKTGAELLAKAMFDLAVSGRSPAYAQMILDRIEGKVPDILLAPKIDDMSTEQLLQELRGVADAVDPPDPNANGCLGDRPGDS